MEVNKLIEIAEWLGSSEDVLKLTAINELNEAGKFYVTIWGHYSAGKSKLINRILDRDILPVKSRETTAVLTYIQYGEQEECHIINRDGNRIVESIAKVKEIFQDAESEVDISDVDYIEVYVNCDILKGGLVLIDTPGVNTLIQKHQELAFSAINLSGKIVYVLGNSPTDVDRKFITQISKCGIEIVFVRTKCDKIVEEEESIEEALRLEKKQVSQYSSQDCTFIPVSNELENRRSDNINTVRGTLLHIAQAITEELHKSIQNRLKVYAASYVEELEERCSQIERTMSGNLEKIVEEVEQCSWEIQKLDELVEGCDKSIERKVNQTKSIAKREMDSLVDRSVEAFSEKLKNITCSSDASDIVANLYDSALEETIREMQQIMNGHFTAIIQEEQEIVQGVVQHLDAMPVPSYIEVQKENSLQFQMYKERYQEKINELSNLKVERQVKEQELSSKQECFDEETYDNALEELRMQLADIPKEAPLYEVEQGIQPSEVFKRIGQAADLALLLIPGDAIVAGIKGVANTTKIAQGLHKMGKVGEVVLKGGGQLAKNANAIDRVRDFTYAINNVMSKRRYSTKKEKQMATQLVDTVAHKVGDGFENFKNSKKEGNVLDALSVAYWTEKFGKMFDKPPIMQVDVFQEQYNQEVRRKIALEQNRLSQERIRKKRELGLIETEQKELAIKEQEQKKVAEQIETELQKAKAENIKMANIDALNDYKKRYQTFFEENVKEAATLLREGYYSSVNQNLTFYVAKQNTEIKNLLKEKKGELEELLRMKEQGNEELSVKLDTGKAYLTYAKGLV